MSNGTTRKLIMSAIEQADLSNEIQLKRDSNGLPAMSHTHGTNQKITVNLEVNSKTIEIIFAVWGDFEIQTWADMATAKLAYAQSFLLSLAIKKALSDDRKITQAIAKLKKQLPKLPKYNNIKIFPVKIVSSLEEAFSD